MNVYLKGGNVTYRVFGAFDIKVPEYHKIEFKYKKYDRENMACSNICPRTKCIKREIIIFLNNKLHINLQWIRLCTDKKRNKERK